MNINKKKRERIHHFYLLETIIYALKFIKINLLILIENHFIFSFLQFRSTIPATISLKWVASHQNVPRKNRKLRRLTLGKAFFFLLLLKEIKYF